MPLPVLVSVPEDGGPLQRQAEHGDGAGDGRRNGGDEDGIASGE